MKKIRTALIDDEDDARYLLRRMLEQAFPQIEICGEADDVDTGAALLLETKPELVFLDIKMPKGTGFDLLESVGEGDFDVIFLTAYNQFAIIFSVLVCLLGFCSTTLSKRFLIDIFGQLPFGEVMMTLATGEQVSFEDYFRSLI